jgi:hypothetical protein
LSTRLVVEPLPKLALIHISQEFRVDILPRNQDRMTLGNTHVLGHVLRHVSLYRYLLYHSWLHVLVVVGWLHGCGLFGSGVADSGEFLLALAFVGILSRRMTVSLLPPRRW